MGNFTSIENRFLVVLSIVAVVFLSSCSDDKQVTTQQADVGKSIVGNSKNMTANKLDDKQYYKEMSKPMDKASWVEKGKFKKEFTKDCINRELQSAEKNKADTGFIEKTCACIADYMDEHLTDQEAEEFLGEDNHMRALQIKYDTAAYQCIQGAKKIEDPKVTRFQ